MRVARGILRGAYNVSNLRHSATSNPRLVAQVALVFEREADALEKSARFRGVDERQEVARLRDIACELDLAAREAGFCGYPFGEEV